MYILGIMIYLTGFVSLAYLIEETDVIDGFGGVMIIFLILATTMILGTFLMKFAELKGNNRDNDKDNDEK